MRNSKSPPIWLFLILCGYSHINGQSWEVLYTHPTSGIVDVFFTDKLNGWIVGKDGTVLHSTDGGHQWHEHDLEVDTNLDAVYFSNIMNGWIIGDSGKIFHTVDSGSTWITQETGTTHYLRDIFFLNETVGWAVGPTDPFHGFILRTSDGGQNWLPIVEEMTGAIMAINFITEEEGWVVGTEAIFDNFEDPIIWHTTDGGDSWEEQGWPQYFYGPLVKVRFWDENIGCAVGMNERILHTTDGGQNWVAVDVQEGPLVTNCCFSDVEMTDSLHIWLNHYLHIYHSSDGGSTWEVQWDWPQDLGFIADYGISMIDSLHGWALTDNTVVGYSPGAIPVSTDSERELPTAFSLRENYPNPFNPATTIQYDLPRSGHVSLIIYDLLGQEVEVAVSKWQVAGTHLVVWDATNMSTGIYLVRMVSGDFSQVKKVMVLK